MNGVCDTKSVICPAKNRVCATKPDGRLGFPGKRPAVVAEQNLDAKIADEFRLAIRGAADAAPGHEKRDECRRQLEAAAQAQSGLIRRRAERVIVIELHAKIQS